MLRGFFAVPSRSLSSLSRRQLVRHERLIVLGAVPIINSILSFYSEEKKRKETDSMKGTDVRNT